MQCQIVASGDIREKGFLTEGRAWNFVTSTFSSIRLNVVDLCIPSTVSYPFFRVHCKECLSSDGNRR